jgi:hypothetical protein
MLNFETYVARHGEFGVQAIIERWERYEGIRANINTPLEARWAAFIGNDNTHIHSQQRMVA